MNEKTMNTREMKIGVVDVPCDNEEQDALKIRKYIDGLEDFIIKCPTPMSIAIQGDWGTGKTSIINMLQKRLDKRDVIKSVYFNTWQYSQFNMADNLYISFVDALVQKCTTYPDKAKELLVLIRKMSTKLLYNTVKDSTGLDVEELFEKQEERMQSVESLKHRFAEMVQAEVKKNEDGRLVVFIDDLDRLNPEVAVELLEVIKLFMDVEKCIFVLAIDYEVVVSGVRSKYGQNVSEEKCRKFFDKIIQLPFRLPVESYCLDGLVKEMVSDDILENDIKPLTKFVNDYLGYNPRAYKRLANSFFLIKSVKEVEQDNNAQMLLNNAQIFACLCVQMCVPKAYEVLVSITELKDLKELTAIMEAEEVEVYLNKAELGQDLKDEEKRRVSVCLASFNNFLSEIEGNHSDVPEFSKCLLGVLQMTAITSVESGEEKKKRATALKVNKIIINGREQSVGTPTEAMIKSYYELLANNPDMRHDYCEKEKRLLTDDSSSEKSFFRNKKTLFEEDGHTIYIGVSSSTKDKMKYTAELCEFMKEHDKAAHVVWMYNGIEVFDSDNSR